VLNPGDDFKRMGTLVPEGAVRAHLYLQTQMSYQPTLQSQHNGNGRPSLRDLCGGERVEAVFAVRERELRQKKNGEPFLKLMLGDRSGSIEAVAWEQAEAGYRTAEPGAILHVSGTFEQSERWGAKLKIQELRPARPEEFDPEDLLAGPAIEVERLEGDLRRLLTTIQHPQLGELLERFFGQASPIWPRFRDVPAAKVYHQAYRHGLLEHTISVAQAVSAAAAFFPGVDRDIAVTGALLHDIGKTEAYNDDPLAIDLTDAGRLQGEIPLGYYMVRREIERIEGFDPGLAQAVVHIVLSHHGALEHGSPVVPATREAALVHAIDNLGGKLGSFDRLERELPDGEAWSGWDRALESAAFFSSKAA
jgi:3'-5' exoribonuclease